jgi:hypothetical protein
LPRACVSGLLEPTLMNLQLQGQACCVRCGGAFADLGSAAPPPRFYCVNPMCINCHTPASTHPNPPCHLHIRRGSADGDGVYEAPPASGNYIPSRTFSENLKDEENRPTVKGPSRLPLFATSPQSRFKNTEATSPGRRVSQVHQPHQTPAQPGPPPTRPVANTSPFRT